jgi:predicted dienelactone hydrolase
MPGRHRDHCGLTLAASIIGLSLAACVPQLTGDEKADRGAYRVRQEVLSWFDFGRLREIPLRAYIPDTADGPYPVVVFSPGIGTSRDHYASLGMYWATHGYLAVFMSHPGADDAAIYGEHPAVLAVLDAVRDYAHQVTARSDHPRDVAFVLDQIEQSPVLRPQADLNRIAVAGHSFGAFTALALIGMRVNTLAGPNQELRDPRIKVAIAMSPPGPGALGLADDAWTTLATPCLTLMGTLDWDPETTDPRERRTAFEQSSAADQFLATLRGATHGVFDEQSPWRLDGSAYQQHHGAIELVTTAFLEAYLRRDAGAQQWLLDRDIEHQTDGACTLEYRQVMPIAP